MKWKLELILFCGVFFVEVSMQEFMIGVKSGRIRFCFFKKGECELYL